VFTGLESPTHLIIVLVVVLLLFGAKRIPEVARGLGAGVREFKKGAEGDGARGGLRPPRGVKTTLGSSHAGLIHPSAWKVDAPKSFAGSCIQRIALMLASLLGPIDLHA